MGKTERISSHCACLATSVFGGAGKFNVVIILFTAASSIRRGLPETARRPLFALLDTAKQSPPPPRVVLLQSRSSLTRSANSSGKFDRKIAHSAVPYSTTVRSCNLPGAGLSGVTRTAIRTAGSAGKNRASCSAHPRSSAMSVILRFCPVATNLRILRVLVARRARTHPARTRDAMSRGGNCTPTTKIFEGMRTVEPAEMPQT